MYGSEMPSRELLPPPIPPFRMFGAHGYLPPPPPPPPLPTPYRYSTVQIKGMYSNPCTPRNVNYGPNRIQRRREMKSANTSNSMPAINNSLNGPLPKPSNGYTANDQSSSTTTTITTITTATIAITMAASVVITTTTDASAGAGAGAGAAAGAAAAAATTTTTTTTPVGNQNANNEMKIPPEWMKRHTCELCKIKLNGNLQADAHYEGKNHAKKARQYLEQLWQAKGNKTPLPASIIKETKEKKSPPLTEMYCKLCDVAFTSDIQANQHHNGRNHQRRLRGEPPLPKGFFNPLTKTWQRQPPVGVPYTVPKESKEPKKYPSKYYCNVCSTSVTSQAQLDSHMSGSRHKMKESIGLKISPKTVES